MVEKWKIPTIKSDEELSKISCFWRVWPRYHNSSLIVKLLWQIEGIHTNLVEKNVPFPRGRTKSLIQKEPPKISKGIKNWATLLCTNLGQLLETWIDPWWLSSWSEDSKPQFWKSQDAHMIWVKGVSGGINLKLPRRNWLATNEWSWWRRGDGNSLKG